MNFRWEVWSNFVFYPPVNNKIVFNLHQTFLWWKLILWQHYVISLGLAEKIWISGENFSNVEFPTFEPFITIIFCWRTSKIDKTFSLLKHLYIWCVLRIACQTAGPIRLSFFIIRSLKKKKNFQNILTRVERRNRVSSIKFQNWKHIGGYLDVHKR